MNATSREQLFDYVNYKIFLYCKHINALTLNAFETQFEIDDQQSLFITNLVI